MLTRKLLALSLVFVFATVGSVYAKTYTIKVLEAQFKAVGASPQMLPFSEVYSALQQGWSTDKKTPSPSSLPGSSTKF